MFLKKSITVFAAALLLNVSVILSQQFETPPARSSNTTQDSSANSRLLPQDESSRRTASEFLSPARGIPEIRVNDLRGNSGVMGGSAVPLPENATPSTRPQSAFSDASDTGFTSKPSAASPGQPQGFSENSTAAQMNPASSPASRSFEDSPRAISSQNSQSHAGAFSAAGDNGQMPSEFKSIAAETGNADSSSDLQTNGQQNQGGEPPGLRPLRSISETPPAISDLRELKPWNPSESNQRGVNQGQFSDNSISNPRNLGGQDNTESPQGDQWYPGERRGSRVAENPEPSHFNASPSVPNFASPESPSQVAHDPLAHLPRLEPYRDPNVAGATYQSPTGSSTPASPLTPNRLLPISDAETVQTNQASETEYITKFLDEFRIESAQQPLPGMPLEISVAIGQSSPGQRIEMVAQYWNTYRAWVLLKEAQTSEAQLRQISKSMNNQDGQLLNAAVASATGSVRAAEIELLREQIRLQTFLYNSDATTFLALPANLPLTQNYETHYEWYASRNLVRSEHRSINQLLPKMRDLINVQAAAARGHQTAIEQILNGLNGGQTNVSTALFAHQEYFKSRQRLLNAIVNYNLEISDYSLAISSFDRPPEQLAQMLVAPVRATSVNVSVNQNMANQSSPVGFRQASVSQSGSLNPAPSNSGTFSANDGREARPNSILDSRPPAVNSTPASTPTQTPVPTSQDQQGFGGQPLPVRPLGGQGSPLTPAGNSNGSPFGQNTPANDGYGALPSSRGNQPATNNQGPISDPPASRTFNTNEFGNGSNTGTSEGPQTSSSGNSFNPPQIPPSQPKQNIGGGGGFDPFQ